MSSSKARPDRNSDAFDLERFVAAQEDTFEAACAELADGLKRSHWMWFVFPQLRGLGQSSTALRFGIGSLEEASAYLAHPVLGPRLRHAAQLMLAIEGRTAHEVLGFPDDLKLRSSMTLFERTGADNAVFQAVLDRYFEGKADDATLRLLADQQRPSR